MGKKSGIERFEQIFRGVAAGAAATLLMLFGIFGLATGKIFVVGRVGAESQLIGEAAYIYAASLIFAAIATAPVKKSPKVTWILFAIFLMLAITGIFWGR